MISNNHSGDEPLVSVIIPVYNAGRYLNQCLDSVISQTYPALEIMIVDDGSRDSSGSICDGYAEKDSRITVFHIKNVGLSAARNYALDRMSGDYVAFVDSDDWIDNDTIELLINAVREHDADMSVCKFCYEWKNKSKASSGSIQPGVLEGPQIIHAFICESGIENNPVNKLYRKDLFSGVRYPEGKTYEDAASTYKLLLNAAKVVVIDDALYHYRQRKSSISNNYSISNILNYWEAHYYKSLALAGISQECDDKLTGCCIKVIGQMWRWYEGGSREEKNDPETVRILTQMQEYVRTHYDDVIHGTAFSTFEKMICICARTRNPVLMKTLYMSIRLYRKIRREKTFD